MLQKKYRLKKYSAVIATYKLKHILADSNICIYLGKEKQNPQMITKAAFVVSKKIHKRAVVRNRIKRYMRESYRLFLKTSQNSLINKYISVVFVAKSGCLNNCNFHDINASLTSLIS